jgi:hypothetical protein
MRAATVQSLYAKDGVVKLSAKKPLLSLIGFCLITVGLGLSPPLGATVIVTTDRSLFLSSNPIVSTETFDEFFHPTQFPLVNQFITIDLVTDFDPTPAPVWRLDQVSTTSSPPKTATLVQPAIIHHSSGGDLCRFPGKLNISLEAGNGLRRQEGAAQPSRSREIW